MITSSAVIDPPPLKNGGRPERSVVRLGIVPLVDCAPIIVASSMGFFTKQGLRAEIQVEPSWSAVRDKVAFGLLDAAHMIAAMPIASTLGISGIATPMVTALALNLNGNAVTVSNALYCDMLEADPSAAADPQQAGRALARVIDRRRAAGLPLLTFAVVFPFSTHHYLLRYWMRAFGIDPDCDVRLIIVPPPRMAEHLAAGSIDGCCVGEPWNTLAVSRAIGRIVVTGYDIHNNSPEKVLGVRADWAQSHPQTHLAMIRAILDACRWLDDPQHRRQAAAMLAEVVPVDRPLLEASLLGQIAVDGAGHRRILNDFHVFHRYAANFPWRSHAAWLIEQMKQSGQIDAAVDTLAVAQRVYLPEIYRDAAESLGLAYPTVDYKTEGDHASLWLLPQATRPIPMGADVFVDQGRFECNLRGLKGNIVPQVAVDPV